MNAKPETGNAEKLNPIRSQTRAKAIGPLATVVVVLVEVPVMLSLVAFANRTRGHLPV